MANYDFKLKKIFDDLHTHISALQGLNVRAMDSGDPDGTLHGDLSGSIAIHRMCLNHMRVQLKHMSHVPYFKNDIKTCDDTQS